MLLGFPRPAHLAAIEKPQTNIWAFPNLFQYFRQKRALETMQHSVWTVIIFGQLHWRMCECV